MKIQERGHATAPAADAHKKKMHSLPLEIPFYFFKNVKTLPAFLTRIC